MRATGKSGSFKTCFGIRLRLSLPFAIGTASIRRDKSMTLFAISSIAPWVFLVTYRVANA
jgi:hypothetical protein